MTYKKATEKMGRLPSPELKSYFSTTVRIFCPFFWMFETNLKRGGGGRALFIGPTDLKVGPSDREKGPPAAKRAEAGDQRGRDRPTAAPSRPAPGRPSVRSPPGAGEGRRALVDLIRKNFPFPVQNQRRSAIMVLQFLKGLWYTTFV